MLDFDDEAARRIDRTYATADVVAQRAEVLALLAPRPGERVLDVGSGPGYLVASIADAVGAAGAVHGVDPSAAMNGLARARTAGRPQVSIDTGDAVALPYPDASFDAAVSTQVYEYVADVAGALAQLRRVLRPGGRALVLDTDWDSVVWSVADRERHRRVMDAWEQHLAHPHLPRSLPRLLRAAGFAVTAHRVVPLLNVELEDESYSAGTLDLIASFVAGRAGLSRDDADAWRADIRARAGEGDYLFSICRYVFLATAV